MPRESISVRPEYNATPSQLQLAIYKPLGMSQFVPLNEDSAVSTRGQRLPSILHNRSSNSLFTLQRRPTKRTDSVVHIDPFESEDDGHDEDLTIPRATPRRRPQLVSAQTELDPRRSSLGPEILMTPQMRSMRLIGNSNPRYHWHRYYKSDEELSKMSKPVREYYERCNYLVSQYIYIDKLLDSSLPHNLIQEYSTNFKQQQQEQHMATISEEANQSSTNLSSTNSSKTLPLSPSQSPVETKVKRTPRNLYKLPDEETPLISDHAVEDGESEILPEIKYEDDEDVDSDSNVVTVAIYINLVANILLLIGKIAVIVLTSSLSVLASLVDAALDFLSTAIVWTTTFLISRQDQYAYPVGRRRLEPVGVLVFSVIMITSFFQVALECFQRLFSKDHSIVYLGIPAVAIMLSTVAIKGFCWFWCRLVKNSSVQALAQDAMTDVVFNIFSIIFPLVGFYAKVWWLDALGGLLLSFYVIFNWSRTSSIHVRNLCGAAATADQRNVLLYLTMRFAKTIRHIQGLQAYHAGDKLNVEVDIVLDENMNLRDSHDLSESLQYVLESVPIVDRAFVHADYGAWNLPSHMNQQGE